MSKSERSSKSRKTRIFIFANVVLFFFLVIAFGREYVGNIQIEREIEQYQAERTRLEQQKLDTLDLIDELSSEEFLEREARTKHGLAEPGETLVVIQNENPFNDFAEEVDQEIPEVSNPLRWYYYFFDKDAFEALSI